MRTDPATTAPAPRRAANGNGNGQSAPATRTAPRALPAMARPFIWGAGIECSSLPHIGVDQFQWTHHDRHWKEDFRRAVDDLGITTFRYCFPWHVLEPQRGVFDWAWADERMAFFDQLGVELLLDVMHFGTPLWLRQAVGDPEFPEALEEYTHALVSRYGHSIQTWCPFNEPLVSALFSGDFGFWPPHARKWRGYMPVLSRIAQATSRGIRAIRRAAPEATVLLVDTAEHYKSRDPALQSEVARRNARRFILHDLIMGRVDHHHPLYEWLTEYGMSELDIDWLGHNPQSPDIIGLDYYPHGDWQLDCINGQFRQKRADSPAGLYAIAQQYYNRYGLPLMVTETSIEGEAINREIWLEQMIDGCRRLREEGVPMLGLIWWPLIDQVDWDGALTHRVGKIHAVGLYHLHRQKDGSLLRKAAPLASAFAEAARGGDARVGRLESIAIPVPSEDEQLPPLQRVAPPLQLDARAEKHETTLRAPASQAPGLSAESAAVPEASFASHQSPVAHRSTDRYGIVVFCHLRWGFVWQRPQQFLSRFAKKHEILFVEEPMFDRATGSEPTVELHRVMPNVTVACVHAGPDWNRSPRLPAKLRELTQEAIERINENGAFDKPLLWYYSPMDAAWSLGHFANRGIVYDCMDELSQFTGAPPQLIENEARLIRYADVVFTGGYEMGANKGRQHDNVHVFGCGVEFDHFAQAQNPSAPIPADIDFVARPILGWMGVVDERVDYPMIGEMARKRPDWSFAMIGPVVKVDPNHLPHAPNLFWMGGRDYQQLPHYLRAFDVNMMCFALNKATEYINPTKGLEYMATGKPIVSSPVRDVVRQWSDVVYLAHGADEWIAAVEKALDSDAPDRQQRIEKGLALARAGSWERTVQQMQDLIRQAIGREDRRSAGRIEPLSEAELSYTYISTPGS